MLSKARSIKKRSGGCMVIVSFAVGSHSFVALADGISENIDGGRMGKLKFEMERSCNEQ